MQALVPRRLRVHPRLGRRNLLVFLCLYQRKQPPNLPVCDQSASAPMNRNTLGLIVVGSGILFVVGQELLLSPVTVFFGEPLPTEKTGKTYACLQIRRKPQNPSYPPSEMKKTDRKSTRLNSSHLGISYAVF